MRGHSTRRRALTLLISRGSQGRAGLLALLFVLLLVAKHAAAADDDASPTDLPTLRRSLVEAAHPAVMGRALDRLQAHVGPGKSFADLGALADWLGKLPLPRRDHELVLQRRGWAYMKARRGAEGVPVLEAALAASPDDGRSQSYLAECLRLTGRYAEAGEMIAASIKNGFEAPFHRAGIINVGLSLRRDGDSSAAKALPAYVDAMGSYLAVREDPELHAMVARWLYEDLGLHDRPESPRGKLWARTAAEHALVALQTSTTRIARLSQLAHDLAISLRPQAKVPAVRSATFDLLVWAVRLGAPTSELGSHAHPEALTDLAELALDEGRFALAARMLRARASLGRTPRLRRLAQRLPPDLEGP